MNTYKADKYLGTFPFPLPPPPLPLRGSGRIFLRFKSPQICFWLWTIGHTQLTNTPYTRQAKICIISGMQNFHTTHLDITTGFFQLEKYEKNLFSNTCFRITKSNQLNKWMTILTSPQLRISIVLQVCNTLLLIPLLCIKSHKKFWTLTLIILTFFNDVPCQTAETKDWRCYSQHIITTFFKEIDLPSTITPYLL